MGKVQYVTANTSPQESIQLPQQHLYQLLMHAMPEEL